MTSVCRPDAYYVLCRHTLHTLLHYDMHATGTAIYTQYRVKSTSSIRYPGRSPGFHGRMAGHALLYNPSTLFAFALAAAPNISSLSNLHSQGS